MPLDRENPIWLSANLPNAVLLTYPDSGTGPYFNFTSPSHGRRRHSLRRTLRMHPTSTEPVEVLVHEFRDTVGKQGRGGAGCGNCGSADESSRTELVRDLVSLIKEAEPDEAVKVLVFKSADPTISFLTSTVTRIKEYRQEAAKLTGEASLALLFRHLSASRLITIAQIEGRVRAAGSEFVLACDMRFAALESAIFGQFEPAFGLLPGGGAAQHLTRLMGRGRALEVMLSAQDYSAELASGMAGSTEPCPRLSWAISSDHWLNGSRAFPPPATRPSRTESMPSRWHRSRTFAATPMPLAKQYESPQAQGRIRAAMSHGLQTREGEMTLVRMLGELEGPAARPSEDSAMTASPLSTV